jgi:carbonic anhydrase
MDARILPLGVFGLEPGDAHIIRNAGGRVSDDVLRSLLVSTHVLGVRAIAVVHHTECGMARYSDAELRQAVEEATGESAAGIEFQAIDDGDLALEEDLERIRESRLFPSDIEVRGYEYDARTGKLRELA